MRKDGLVETYYIKVIGLVFEKKVLLCGWYLVGWLVGENRLLWVYGLVMGKGEGRDSWSREELWEGEG